MINLKIRTKKNIFLSIFIVCYILLQLLTSYLTNIRFNTFNGVIMAFQFLLCLGMVKVDYVYGGHCAYFLICFSVINLIVVVFKLHTIAPLPGIFNMSIYLVTLVLLSKQFIIREKEAVTDFLTGLSNRRGLYNLLEKKIDANKPFYVVYLDLGNFKLINDNYGHTYGDELLRLVTHRINMILGKNGIATRIGGDEFVLIINGTVNVTELINKMLDVICERSSVILNGTQIDTYLTAYAGVAKYPDDSTNAEALIKYADIAMYQAVKNKTDRIFVFSKDMENELLRKMELEKIIKEALVYDYFYLVYQPQYKLDDKKLRGFESLLRLKTPDGKFVSPAEFIPIAESGDLILLIDDYVINRAMREYKDVVTNSKEELTISVNVSAKNIGSVGFADKIKTYLDKTEFPAKNLEIEITEYCLVQSVETTIENIKLLREMGIQIALDDFGTGYTSLAYLAKMPVNLLKIDKTLIDDIEHSEKSKDFVNAVISMGHLMGCEVISEGVENDKQLDLLNQKNCDFIQGYVWGKPLEYEVAKELALKV